METPFNLASLAPSIPTNPPPAQVRGNAWGKGCDERHVPHCAVIGLDNSYRSKLDRIVHPSGPVALPLLQGPVYRHERTVFEDSHVPLTKCCWPSTCSRVEEGHERPPDSPDAQGQVSKAWFMMHRLRYAMSVGPLADKLRGVIEMDETFLGGKKKGKNAARVRQAEGDGRRLVERGGRARAFPMAMVTMPTFARRSLSTSIRCNRN